MGQHSERERGGKATTVKEEEDKERREYKGGRE